MTAEEKANELVESFAETIPVVYYGQLMERDWFTAKKCAIILCDEIISACEYNHVESYNQIWWEKVKKNINQK